MDKIPILKLVHCHFDTLFVKFVNIFHIVRLFMNEQFMGRNRYIETPVDKAQRIRDLILIRVARTALGLSQRELARVVNLHFSSLARFESGNLRLKKDHIQRILDYFQKAGVSHKDTDDGDLLIHLSGEGLNSLAHIDYTHDSSDFSPRFRL